MLTRTAGREAVAVDVDGVAAARLLLDDDLVAPVQPAVRQVQVRPEVLQRDDGRRLRRRGRRLSWRGGRVRATQPLRRRPRTLDRVRLLHAADVQSAPGEPLVKHDYVHCSLRPRHPFTTMDSSSLGARRRTKHEPTNTPQQER